MASSKSPLSLKKRTVLCIDDEPSCLRFYQQMLEDAGYAVVSYTDARSGLEFFASAQVDLAVLDYSMPQLGGAEVARTIRRMNPGLPIIMVSSWPECPRDAASWVSVYLMKIRDFDELPRNIERLLAAQTGTA
jgi:CheY-like chemotaxis protein